jgi:DNA-binding transcriptional LysR family regulator
MRRADPAVALRREPSNIDVNSMVLFYEVVNSGSISQAALLTKLSKASISRKLRKLEQDVGAVLLKRGQHRISMTSSGEVLYHHCEKILAETQEARTVLSEMQSELAGKLQLVAPFGLGMWVARALAVFAHKYPRVEVAVDLTHRWVDVSEEPYDVAIHLGRIRNERLPVRRLAELARGVYASPDYLRDKRVPQLPVELLRHSCIVLRQQLDDELWTFREANGTRVTVKPRARVSDIVVAREMALAGMGFAILPHAFCRRDIGAGQLVQVLPRWNIPPLIPSATYLERRYMPLRIRAFLDTVAAQFKQDPPAL